MALMIPTSVPANQANPDPPWVAMTIVSDLPPAEQFAYYIARPGVDFPTLGVYSLQARLTFAGGQLLLTNPFNLAVTAAMFTASSIDTVPDVDTVPDWDTIGAAEVVFTQEFMRQRTGWPYWLRRPTNPWA